MGVNEEKVPAWTLETGSATSVRELLQLCFCFATLLLLPQPKGCSGGVSDHQEENSECHRQGFILQGA